MGTVALPNLQVSRETGRRVTYQNMPAPILTHPVSPPLRVRPDDVRHFGSGRWPRNLSVVRSERLGEDIDRFPSQ